MSKLVAGCVKVQRVKGNKGGNQNTVPLRVGMNGATLAGQRRRNSGAQGTSTSASSQSKKSTVKITSKAEALAALKYVHSVAKTAEAVLARSSDTQRPIPCLVALVVVVVMLSPCLPSPMPVRGPC
jgi:cobalamin biosynthesis Mg chelatase CobN